MIKSVATAFLFAPALVVSAREVTVINTFQDVDLTNSMEAILDTKGPSSMYEDSLEFVGFPSTTGNAYDIDVLEDRIIMTLKDNNAVYDWTFPEGRFDRYYFSFASTSNDEEVEAAWIEEEGEDHDLVASVQTLLPGYVLETHDTFEMDLEVPTVLQQKGGLVVTIGPGSHLDELEQELVIHYRMMPASQETESEEEEEEVTVYNTMQDSEDGSEHMDSTFAERYSISVGSDEIVMKLLQRHDSGVERFYFKFTVQEEIRDVELVNDEINALNKHAQVILLEPGFSLNSGDEEDDEMLVFDNWGIMVEFSPFQAEQVIGQTLQVKFTVPEDEEYEVVEAGEDAEDSNEEEEATQEADEQEEAQESQDDEEEETEDVHAAAEEEAQEQVQEQQISEEEHVARRQ
mmetsp:Transcript_21551/g.32923  ORF Transcript_21551/g.32923 Transcript_21551/m.32923 type:complete len:403 (+) Transcript_21551:141-1349(+)|eukprot:CAMPEP_0118685460 /NCGR_PEP_ID=MMETSP0800-20121206/7259_1 /TAXON_ID=210618 ORGANISM="Striatella unipunctata, Strain CCMP2910" /NCGR_SAMPLE_ID=MMETSP0800 /ASSEMBLY_ACC=CAM_ASM_000638 /LENGTH=402 /DNA_ID=CAMNT_0006582375 /DNA_START=133 /DNA_END=1341 /DNA_ORIENTATION=+